ncbi:hypothetical protein V2I01_27115 [Micromonospora sp. BRA006-A]|nr:hypothetical protein [Micromonospora sp. BRA006-A]
MDTRIRQLHRWFSVAFTVTVVITFVALAQKDPIVGLLRATAAARPAPDQRSLPVRAAVPAAPPCRRAPALTWGLPGPVSGQHRRMEQKVMVFAPAPLLTVTIEQQGDVPELHLHPGGRGCGRPG